MILGRRVYQAKLGWGIVKEIISEGQRTAEALVDFGYLSEWFPVFELLVCPDGEPVAMEMPVPSSSLLLVAHHEPQITEHSSQTWAEARKGITALRLGQVLESHIHRLTVGADTIKEVLLDALDRVSGGKPAFLLIEGLWGGGKTHALTLLQALARQQRFATSSAVMDGVSVSLSDPNGLMEEIICSLRLPGDDLAGGLASVLRRAYDQDVVYSLRRHGAVLLADLFNISLPETALEDPEVLQLLEDYCSLTLSPSRFIEKLRTLKCHPGDIPKLRAFRTSERPGRFVELLRNWAGFAAAMNAKGLLVILDELDVDYASTLFNDRGSRRRKELRAELLGQLKAIHACDTPLLVAFASASTTGGVSEDDDAVEEIQSVLGDAVLHVTVPTPSDEDYKLLFHELADLYHQAYDDSSDNPTSCPDELLPLLLSRHHRNPSPVPRRFVRMTLEALDLLSPRDGLSRDEVMTLLAT